MVSVRCPAVYLVLQEVGSLWLASSLRGNRSTMPLAMSAFTPKADIAESDYCQEQTFRITRRAISGIDSKLDAQGR